uniref:Uncharacterized protein n=1 Tax=viral metagenome TaxID=1070528 RepID=A0A6C0M159_9ZZZZ
MYCTDSCFMGITQSTACYGMFPKIKAKSFVVFIYF